MLKKTLLVGFVSLLTLLSSKAQDPHFSMFYASPLTLNPALTGVFSGNYRFSGIFRSQWREVMRNESVPMFRTISASFDIRTKKGFGDRDAFGIGLVVLADKAGELEFGTTSAALSFSYAKALDYRGTQFLTLGFQGGISQRSITTLNARTGMAYDVTTGIYNPFGELDPTLLGADENFIMYDFSAGLLWYMTPKKRLDAYLGLSAFHLNTPKESFVGGDAQVPMKYAAHGGIRFPFVGQTDLIPKFIVLMQGKHFEANIGTEIKFFFESRKPNGNAFYGGVLYRMVGGDSVFGDGPINSESIIFTGKVDYGPISIGVAYDLNFSELIEASFSKGGYEVAFSYIGAFKNKGPKTMYCPKF